MKKLIIVGHPVCHYRQRMLGEATAKLGIKTAVIGPRDWGDEHYKPYVKKNFFFRPLYVAGPPSFYSFNLKKFLRTLSMFRPATIYCMEEMFTLFARECMKHAKNLRCPLWFFTWENKVDFRLSGEFDSIEQDAIRVADGIICGNSLARERMLRLGADKDKLHVLLQSGIDTELFKNLNEEKIFDLIYHGRMVREKGLYYLENACRDLGVHLLTVGGRGKYHFKYGESKDWVDYEDLPSIINAAHIGVQFPFSWHGYQEQGNFAVGENMACCNPVVISNNGSLPDNYGGAPIPMINEGDEESLKKEIVKLLDMSDSKREKLGIDCRKWIIDNLSLEVVGKQLLEILELM